MDIELDRKSIKNKEKSVIELSMRRITLAGYLELQLSSFKGYIRGWPPEAAEGGGG